MKTKKIIITILWAISFSWIASFFIWLALYLGLLPSEDPDLIIFKRVDNYVIVMFIILAVILGWFELLPGTKSKDIIKQVNNGDADTSIKRYEIRYIATCFLLFIIEIILLNFTFSIYSSVIIGTSWSKPDYYKQFVLFCHEKGIDCDTKGDYISVATKIIADKGNKEMLGRFNNKYFSNVNWFVPTIIITILILIPLGFISGYYGKYWCYSMILIVPVYLFIRHTPSGVPSENTDIFTMSQKTIILITSLVVLCGSSYYGYKMKLKRNNRAKPAESTGDGVVGV